MSVPITLQIQPNFGSVASSAVRLTKDLLGLAVGDRNRYKAELVAEEVLLNIVKYGGVDTSQEPIVLEVHPTETGLKMSFLDTGRPFDPRCAQDPGKPATIDDATPGGLGLYLINQTASHLDYVRQEDGRNRLDVWLDDAA